MVADDPRTENSGDHRPESEAELSDRLDRLDARLGEHRAREEAEKKRTVDQNRGAAGYGKAFRLSSEFIAGVLVGCGIGWVVDTWFGTKPWGLIVFLLLGFAAGVLNVLRSAGLVQEAIPPGNDGNQDRPD